MAEYVVYYKDDKRTIKHCKFEVGDGAGVTDCGVPAYGQRGLGGAVTPLCKEHFEYSQGLDGMISRPTKEGSW